MKGFISLTLAFLALPLSIRADEKGVTLNADSTVTLRLDAPRAKKVEVEGTFMPFAFKLNTVAGAITKEVKGVMAKKGGNWVYTTQKLPSELYTYRYWVDGMPMTDPAHTNIVRDVDQYASYFIVGGGLGDYYATRDVPHGQVTQLWYPSKLDGMTQRRMTVYTPPSYNDGKGRSYPVLYLLHGSGGDENAWLEKGRLAQIMDNLIAEGKTREMLVVMPNGIAELDAAPGQGVDGQQKAIAFSTYSMTGIIERTLATEVVGYVDGHFRTVKSKQGRAIAGLSMGGLHTIFTAANNPSMFAYVGLFSAQTTNMLNDRRILGLNKLADKAQKFLDKVPRLIESKLGGKANRYTDRLSDGSIDIYADIDKKLKAQFKDGVKLYYIAVGRDDFVKKLNDDFREKLDQGGYNYVYNETDGGHTWENWRKYLLDFAPRLFK